MTVRASAIVFAAGLSACFAARPVPTSPAPSPPPPPARDLVAEAAAANAAGEALWEKDDDLSGAIVQFREAVELDPKPRYLFNLGYALHQRGAYEEAKAPLARVIAEAEDPKLIDKAEIVLEDIRRRVGTITSSVSRAS